MALDDSLLAAYIRQFYGYGSPQAPYWLVGMEEGGGNSAAEITSRLETWRRRGCPELDDVAEFHESCGPELAKWFRPNPPLQSTWCKLIRLLLAVQGLPVSTEAVRGYQGGKLGRAGGETAILELLPLPSPSTDHWPYSSLSALPYLRDRSIYRQTVLPHRAGELRRLIQQREPALVVFYSLTYRETWQQLCPVPLRATSLDGFYLAESGRTLIAVTKHPVATGVTNAYFEEAGALIRQRLLPQAARPVATVPSPPEAWPRGARVHSPHFGVGYVLGCSGPPGREMVEIQFDFSGTRKLFPQAACLQRLP